MNLAILCLFIIILIVLITYLNFHPFLALLGIGILFGITMGMSFDKVFETLIDGLAGTFRWIGVVIIFGAVIGEILAQTGAALLISNLVLKIVGEKRVSLMMGITGYVVGVPVFVDVAYVMLQPITEALAARSRKTILFIGLSLVAGLTTTHALLPPTPGPLAGAAILNANLGTVILVNAVVALFSVVGGLLWAHFYCRPRQIPYDKVLWERVPQDHAESDQSAPANMVLLAISSIILPLVLIAIGSVSGVNLNLTGQGILRILGTPSIALFIGLLLATFLLNRGTRTQNVTRIFDRSIEKVAVVLMITAAGGAFGAVIKASEIGPSVASTVAAMGLPAFILPYVLAVGLTTSTGSITVSIITASSIVAPMLESLSMSPQMAMALIAAGSLCVIHVNSSFFWLFGRLHQVPPNTLLKSLSVQSACMSVSGLVGVFVLHLSGLL